MVASTYVLVALASALLAALAAPAFARLARAIGLVVRPRDDRWHRQPTPLLGGAAITIGVLVPFVTAAPLDTRSVAIVGCVALAFMLGLLDDFRHIAPTTKLVGQAVIASILALAGVRVELMGSAPLAYLVTVFWVAAIMNAVNLLDNMDGLASGVAVIAAFVLGVTALPGNPGAAALAAATAGACVGFLVHNFHPARVFMGDAGSMVVGFLLATIALRHTASSAADVGLAVLGPLVVLALPIFDTALVTVSRGLAGLPISGGGRDHTSHRLAAIGLSDRATVVALYVVAAALAALGLALEAISAVVAPLLALAVVALVLFGIFLTDIDVYGRKTRPQTRPIRRAISVYGRFGTEVGLDVLLLTTAYYAAYLIRFEGMPQGVWLHLFVGSVPFVLAAQLAGLVGVGVYRTLWRYIGIADGVAIIQALTLGTGAAVVAVLIAYRFEEYSRAVFILDWLLATTLVGGARFFLLWLHHIPRRVTSRGAKRVLIVGANDGGLFAQRILRRTQGDSHEIVGFLDDDPGKRYRRISGVPVVGTIDDLAAAVAKLRIDLVVVADDQPANQERSQKACRTLGIDCRLLQAAEA